MLTLRKYRESDGNTVLSWIKDENAFRMWCADRFEKYPLSPLDFNEIYRSGQLKGFVAYDEDQMIGHLFMQTLSEKTVKFGLIIVDAEKRGKGYGSKMLIAALDYAKSSLSAKRVILSAFDTNPAAYSCYKRLGFNETGKVKEFLFFNETHRYFELEYEI